MISVNTILAVLAVCLILTACDTGPPPDVKRSINCSDKFKHRQMVASFNVLPSDKKTDLYTHFHPPESMGDRVRTITNFYEILDNTGVKYLSIGCDTASVCGDIIRSTLKYALMKNFYRNDMTFILPEYLEPLHEELDKLGIDTLIYKTPSLKGSDVFIKSC